MNQAFNKEVYSSLLTDLTAFEYFFRFLYWKTRQTIKTSCSGIKIIWYEKKPIGFKVLLQSVVVAVVFQAVSNPNLGPVDLTITTVALVGDGNHSDLVGLLQGDPPPRVSLCTYVCARIIGKICCSDSINGIGSILCSWQAKRLLCRTF